MSRSARRSAREVILARRALFLGAALGGVMAPSRVAAQGAADDAAPDDAAPDDAAPDAAPDSAAPDSAAPDSAAPDDAERDDAAPDSAAPEVVEPGLVHPEGPEVAPRVCLTDPHVCLSIEPYSPARRGPAFALGGSLPALVSLAEDASPYFLGLQLDAIFHYGIARIVDWRLAASGAALGGRDGAAGAVGGWTGLRLTPEDSPLMFGFGVAGGYLFLPDMLSPDPLPVSSPFLAPYISPLGAQFDELETDLRVSLWLTEQASPTDTRFGPSFVQISFWVGYGFYREPDEVKSLARRRRSQ